MSAEQITPTLFPRRLPLNGTKRILIALTAFLAAAAGVVALIRPFLKPSSVWQWRLSDTSNLKEARVNAEVISIDSDGLLIARRGMRHISVITPPLALPSDVGRVLSMEIAAPDVPAGQIISSEAVFLWQTENVPEFKYFRQNVELQAEAKSLIFDLPRPASQIHRLGIQFPGLPGPIRLRSIGLPSLSLGDRIRLAWTQIKLPERFDNARLNFFHGPRALGYGLNYYLVSLLAAAVGSIVGLSMILARRVHTRLIIALMLAAWFSADVLATMNLARQSAAELADLRGHLWSEQIARVYGRDISWCYGQLLAHSKAGDRFAVAGDDPFGPAHRLAYLLTPLRTREESYTKADFIVVVRGSNTVFDERRGQFRAGDGPWASVERIAVLTPTTFLLQRRLP